MNTQPTTPQPESEVDRAKRMLAGAQTLQAEVDALGMGSPVKTSFDLGALIDQARVNLKVGAVHKEEASAEIGDPEIANMLLARRAEVERGIKELTAEKDQIGQFFADYAATLEESGATVETVTVHGAPVFTWKTVTSRVLDQAAVKRLFPDTPENAELWKDQVTRPKKFSS